MLSYSVTTTVLPSFVGSEMLGSGIGHHKNRHSSYLDKIFFLEVLRTIFFQKKNRRNFYHRRTFYTSLLQKFPFTQNPKNAKFASEKCCRQKLLR